MSKKNNRSHSAGHVTSNANGVDKNSAAWQEFESAISDYVKRATELDREGFVPVFLPELGFYGGMSIDSDTQEMYGGHQHLGGSSDTFGFMADNLMIASPGIIEMNEGLGAVPWGGARNRLPLDIYRSAKRLPYTSACMDYRSNLMYGDGPTLVYRYVDVVNGAPVDRVVEFANAEAVLIERVAKWRKAMLDEQKNTAVPGFVVPQGAGVQEGAEGAEPLNYRRKKAEPVAKPDPLEGVDFNEIGSAKWQYKMAMEDYKAFKIASEEISDFLENNDIEGNYMDYVQDNSACDLAFSYFGLSADAEHPKIVNVETIPVVCARYEKRDEKCNINHIYYNEAWRKDELDSLLDDKAAVFLKVVGKTRKSQDGSRGFRKQLNEYIEERRSIKSASERTAQGYDWYVTPLAYGSNENAYYKVPNWWSIYFCLMYSYSSTYFVDKSIARKNSTMFRKIIYVNLDWLEKLRSSSAEGIQPGDKDAMKAFRNRVVARVNSFLRDKSNTGKSIVADTFIGNDGKEHRAFEIVAVPEPKNEVASTADLADIQSIISWAMGVHGALQGDRPGTKSSGSGGTFQRELHMLAENMYSSRTKIWVRHYNDIVHFNWPELKGHLGWTIGRQLLTTLDNSKTGVVDVLE